MQIHIKHQNEEQLWSQMWHGCSCEVCGVFHTHTSVSYCLYRMRQNTKTLRVTLRWKCIVYERKMTRLVQAARKLKYSLSTTVVTRKASPYERHIKLWPHQVLLLPGKNINLRLSWVQAHRHMSGTWCVLLFELVNLKVWRVQRCFSVYHGC